MSVSPAEFPPPFDPSEAVAEPTDPADERIEVGFLIVGAGPAPTTSRPTSIRSSSGSVGAAIASSALQGGG